MPRPVAATPPPPVRPVPATPPPPPPRLVPAAPPPAPFVAAAPSPAVPPRWPTAAPEPRARPPFDPSIPTRLAVATAGAARPLPQDSLARPPAAKRPTTIIRPRPSLVASRPLVSFPTVLAVVSILLLFGAAAVLLGGPKQGQVVAGATDAPTGGAAGVPGGQIPATIDPWTAETDQPGASPGTVGGGASTTPRPDSTPRPRRSPSPTPRPTHAPTPPPAPTPTPAPITPKPMCTVPSLIGQQTSNVPQVWSAAGFTGSIAYNPQIPPQFRIAWQSLPVGSSEPCASGITVKKIAP
jgi:hypothetical protein